MDDSALRQRLLELNGASSKHAGYQSLPDFVNRTLGLDFEIDADWRGDRNRFERIVAAVEPGRVVVDIGANGGFFCLGLAHDLPTTGHAWEPNPDHAEIIRLLADRFELPVEVHEAGVDLAGAADVEGDVILLMNVLHHAGREFDHDLVAEPAQVWSYAQQYLTALHRPGRSLVWQLGYRWGGDRSTPICDIDAPFAFLQDQRRILAAAGWEVDATWYPRRREDGRPRYEQVDPDDLAERVAAGATEADVVDQLGLAEHPGEFHRRPLLFCNATDR